MNTYTLKSNEPMVVVKLSEFDRMRETIEILSNRETMRAIRRGRKEAVEGKTVELEEFWRKEMGNSLKSASQSKDNPRSC